MTDHLHQIAEASEPTMLEWAIITAAMTVPAAGIALALTVFLIAMKLVLS